MNEKWFFLSIAQIEQKLKTNAASGLSRKAARSAWRYYFPKTGALYIHKKKSFARIIGDILSDFALVLLLILSALAVLFGDKTVGITVLLITLMGVMISAVCYYRCQRSAEQIEEYFLPTANVIRGGKLYRVAFENVIPGDVILLEKGDIVCADARIVTSDNLKVAMRVDMKKYMSLRKQATAINDENENNLFKYTNILHAGSIIEEGSARAIVYATGKYTYLGALTGGISESYSDTPPKELKKMKKICSAISMISMMCILPFSMISLIFSHFDGGTATLSIAFLTALALSASCFTPLVCTVCRLFFVKKIKELSKDDNPTVVRSCDTLEKLMNVKHIFMLDGCAVSDGVLHFETAFTAEGDVKSFENYTPSVQRLFTVASLYNSAEANALSVGGYDPHRFKEGMGEFLSHGQIDEEALKIRYPIRSYVPGTESHPFDRVFFTDNGRKMVLGVCRSEDILSLCNYAVIGGRIQPLASVGADRLKHTYNMQVSKGKKVLLFTIASFENDATHTDRCFIGGIVLREGVDSAALKSISALRKRGINVVSFVGSNAYAQTPRIPTELCFGNRISKTDIDTNDLSLFYKFGDIDTYCDFDEKDILELMRYAHQNGESVGVIGFSDFAPEVISEADVFISCSSLVNVFSAKDEQELYTLETAGVGTSRSCIQTVRSEADVLINRPVNNKGGISTLLKTIACAEVACRNLMDFFRYIICIQIIRLLIVGIPMIFGRSILDARHVLVCSFLVDPVVLIMFALSTRPSRRTEVKKISTLRSHVRSDASLTIVSAVSAIIAVCLPMLVDMIGFMGPYLYRVEYLFFAMLWLNVTVIYYVRYGSIIKIKHAIRNKLFVALVIGIATLSLILILWDRFGLVFEMLYHPLPYIILSIIPACMFVLTTSALATIKKNK